MSQKKKYQQTTTKDNQKIIELAPKTYLEFLIEKVTILWGLMEQVQLT